MCSSYVVIHLTWSNLHPGIYITFSKNALHQLLCVKTYVGSYVILTVGHGTEYFKVTSSKTIKLSDARIQMQVY